MNNVAIADDTRVVEHLDNMMEADIVSHSKIMLIKCSVTFVQLTIAKMST